MRRGKRRWWLIALLVVIIVAAAAVGAVLWFGRSKTATVHYLTATATDGTIAQTVQADFTLVSSASSVDLMTNGASSRSTTSSSTGSTAASSTSGGSTSSSGTASSTSSGAAVATSDSGVVTALDATIGESMSTLQPLLSASGSPLYAFVSSTPLYENLSTSLTAGTDEANVEALQAALRAKGYYTGSIDGTFGTDTQTALEDWQAAEGLSETGVLDISQFVWVPKGAVLESWNVGVGSRLSGSTSVASVVFPRDLEAQAQVSQADIASLKVGQKAELTISGVNAASFPATITFIDSQPASSSSSAASGSSSSVDYNVNLQPQDLPAVARLGMTGTLTIILAQRNNVLLVPTSAVSGSTSSAYVQVMINGVPAYRQVATGMTTSSLTQITSGLASGEVVVTGTYTNAATSSSSTTTTGSGLSGLGGFGGAGFGSGSGGAFHRSSGGTSGSSSSGSSGSSSTGAGQ
jgi:multidrug efflux pump subunit AcrA (membrane-fusion protein)